MNTEQDCQHGHYARGQVHTLGCEPTGGVIVEESAAERIAKHKGWADYEPIQGRTAVLCTIAQVANNLDASAQRYYRGGYTELARDAHRDANVLRRALGLELVPFTPEG